VSRHCRLMIIIGEMNTSLKRLFRASSPQSKPEAEFREVPPVPNDRRCSLEVVQKK
jgi:hypothetical protein